MVHICPFTCTDVTIPANELSGQFDGHRYLFEWKERRVKVKLHDNTSILTFTINESAFSADRFKLPPSVVCRSQVYELSCTHSDPRNAQTLCDSADITIPYRREVSTGPHFYVGKRTPQWQCDLSPIYNFHDTKSGTFDHSLGTYSVQSFNCFICVCSKS